MNKLIVILGPTATGKTDFAVRIASNIQNAEIISADSRQVYKYMNIGTGKDLHSYSIKNKIIPYHLIDILEPTVNYSVYDFKRDFKNAAKQISDNNNIPILCGGTGLYIESILLNYQISKSPPNQSLRNKFENYTFKKLVTYLQLTFPKEYRKSYHISKRRIIRTIEICSFNKSEKLTDMDINTQKQLANSLVLGVELDRPSILSKIKQRLHDRIKEGMIEEVEELIAMGISIERLKYFGLEYRYIAQYLNKELTLDRMIEKLNYAINRFSKRQMTFYRRMEKRGINIHWINTKSKKGMNLINKFLKR